MQRPEVSVLASYVARACSSSTGSNLGLGGRPRTGHRWAWLRSGWGGLPPFSSPGAPCSWGGGLRSGGRRQPRTLGQVGSPHPMPVALVSSSVGLGLSVGLRVGGSLVLFPTPNPLQLLSSPGRTVVLEGREIVILSWSLASDQGTTDGCVGAWQQGGLEGPELGLAGRAAHMINYGGCWGAGRDPP